MTPEANNAAHRIAACIAFRHIAEVSEHEREQVLIALIDLLPEREAELAERMLFHFREQRRIQMELTLALDAGRAAQAAN